jgi:hypothetical protein
LQGFGPQLVSLSRTVNFQNLSARWKISGRFGSKRHDVSLEQ